MRDYAYGNFYIVSQRQREDCQHVLHLRCPITDFTPVILFFILAIVYMDCHLESNK